MTQLSAQLISQLHELRQQGMKMAEVNPIAALADEISDKLSKGEINVDDLDQMLDEIGGDLWQEMSARLATQTAVGLNDEIPDLGTLIVNHDVEKLIYRAVFTAHPVFALTRDSADKLCESAGSYAKTGTGTPMPEDAFATRPSVSLVEEHLEAMAALTRARGAISNVNRQIITHQRGLDSASWRDKLPQMMGVATWVGHDLDGRTDITWSQSISLRLSEKIQALTLYKDSLAKIGLPETDAVCATLVDEITACQSDHDGFANLDLSHDDFAQTANQLTERKARMTQPFALSAQLHELAKAWDDDVKAEAIMLIAADIRTHGFGMGEMHLRINAVQLRNAMRSVDGRPVSASDRAISNRQLLERLATRIISEEPWQINFGTLKNEAATARRQLMLAAQILKHIDSDMPIRLLIAECEKPITYMSALYLAHKLGIADKLDISPLFETTFGLEHGVQMMKQLLGFAPVQSYIRTRGRLAVQTGFSDAGRFMGQIAANFAIERLQIKLSSLCYEVFGSDIELLIFNTHGESLGRGCGRPTIKERQDFIFTPFSRNHARQMGCPIHHQSSFQGCDGYRLFGTDALAYATISSLFVAELSPPSAESRSDAFYDNPDFSLDLFLSLKNWHEGLFNEPQYGQLLDMFGANMLPKTGSRPAKRKLQAGMERLDPSKIRAIPHNAILQQLGFLAVVISGMGTAANADKERFVEMYHASPRLQQCMAHISEAKQLGSLNTVLAYGRLMDNGFWIDKAYHGSQPRNQRAFRQIGSYLRPSTAAVAVRQTVWKLREDLIDLYRLTSQLDTGSVRTLGEDRSDLDLLQAIRIAVIMDAIVRVFQVPRFAESNRFSQSDLYEAAISLEFDLVDQIVSAEFPAEEATDNLGEIGEPEDYSTTASLSYADTTQKIRQPLVQRKNLIQKITQLVSAKYGAHG
jgi:phosphoenolpyruvate carboxylase